MSSLEATPEEYDPDDWQLLKTKENYPLSKFQTDLLATRLDLIALEADAKANTGARSGEKVKVKATATATATATRHIIVQPGVVATSIVASYLNFFTAWCMRAAFWIVSHSLCCPTRSRLRLFLLMLVSTCAAC
jgi:3-keto steroid reductase